MKRKTGFWGDACAFPKPHWATMNSEGPKSKDHKVENLSLGDLMLNVSLDAAP